MSKVQRTFPCRDEELIPIAKFLSFSLKRDKNEISQVYNNINPDYIAATDALIAEVENLIEPQAETLAKKQITRALYESMEQIASRINFLATYLKLSKKELKLSDTDFGISALRKALRKEDVEAVVDNLKIVLTHTKKYSTVLQAHGMSSSFEAELDAMGAKIAADRQTQYELLSNRKNIVQNNIQKLNELYSRMGDIFSIGKSIYSKTNAVKANDYAFKKLLSKVRQIAKPKSATAGADLQSVPSTITENNKI